MDWAAFFSVAWQQAMLAMLPLFVWLRWTRGRWPMHRLRTWAALFGASLSAWLVTPEHGDTPFLLYALICLAGVYAASPPSGAGATAKTSLQSKGWTVTTD